MYSFKTFDLRKYDGEKIIEKPTSSKLADWLVFNGRGELHMLGFYYAKDILGIPILRWRKVILYCEDTGGAGAVSGMQLLEVMASVRRREYLYLHIMINREALDMQSFVYGSQRNRF